MKNFNHVRDKIDHEIQEMDRRFSSITIQNFKNSLKNQSKDRDKTPSVMLFSGSEKEELGKKLLNLF